MIDKKQTSGDATELSPAKRRLVELMANDRDRRARSIASASGAEPSVLSFGQRRLWFLDRWSPGSTAYNEFARLRFEGRLDVAALRASLATVVDRHAVLRTVFRETPAGPVQVVTPSVAPLLGHHDLSTRSPAERAARIATLQRDELTTPFDLTSGPLVRAQLIRLGSEDHELMFSVHHIACDGWSLGVFVRELATCYAAFERGETPTLPALDIQYADYARWQIEAAETLHAAAELEYWKHQLPEPAPVLDLPFARRRPAVRGSAGITERFTVGAEMAGLIRDLARAEDATPFMVLLAAFHALLHRYTGDLDIRIGTPVAGRTRVETEPLIGFFVNMLVLRADLSGEPTFRELVRRIRATSLAAYAHQDVPFERLVDALAGRRTLTHTPLFQAAFVLQNAPVEPLVLPRLRVSPVEVDRGTSKFDLLLSLTETPDGLRGGFECSADLFDRAMIAHMAGHFLELLASAVAAPDQRVGTLAMPTATEYLAATQAKTRRFATRDAQVKIRGLRVDLEDIDAVIRQHPAIREAVVVLREDIPGDQRLAAYVVLAAGTSVGLAELRAHVGTQLPDYMVPSAVEVLDAFPLSPNGELDRQALPAPSSASVAPTRGVALTGELEHQLAEQWKHVLKLDVIGATDNFFDAGGHSLNIAALQSRLRDQLGRDVPLVALFQYPTIRELAAYLAGAATGAAATAGQAPARTARRGAQSSRRNLRRNQRGGQDDE